MTDFVSFCLLMSLPDFHCSLRLEIQVLKIEDVPFQSFLMLP